MSRIMSFSGNAINTMACYLALALITRVVEPACAQALPDTCCSALSTAPSLAGKVLLPDTPEYTASLETFWSVSAALDSWCVAQPATSQDVSDIVKLLVANSCTFGIKGGGHGSWNGSNAVAEGVTIDFGVMNTTTYDATLKVASVTPGAHWQSVYNTLSPLGVTVAGGRAGTVGVGGFITGGGNSFFSASHGMACDTVKNFEVVLADGAIVNANAEENPDLWVALKGGSGNFGLVTRFDMYAIEFPDPANPAIWGGIVQYELSAGPSLLDAMAAFNDNVVNDRNTSSIMYWAYLPTLGGMILNVALENTVGDETPLAADVYLKVPGITSNTMRKDDLTVITEELGAGQPAGFRNVWYSLLLPNDPAVMGFAVAAHEFAVSQLETAMTPDSGFNTLCMFQPINNVIAQTGEAKGGNVLGLNATLNGGNAIMFLGTLAVNGEGNEILAQPIMQNWTDSVQRFAEERGTSYGWHYLNYAFQNQDPLSVESVGVEAFDKLHAASTKYDPNGVFQKLRTSGFKIPAKDACPVKR